MFHKTRHCPDLRTAPRMETTNMTRDHTKARFAMDNNQDSRRSRRAFIAGGCASALLMSSGAQALEASIADHTTDHIGAPSCPGADWARFRAAFIAADGAVLDPAQGFVHSEAIGFSALLAVRFNDRATYDALIDFAERHLRRADGLHTWSWLNGAALDANNATDGDIFLAWARLEAHQRWATAVPTRDIEALKTMIVTDGANTLLLPGGVGFQREDGAIILNPSYWVFPALRAFARFTSDRVWSKLFATGLRLIESSAAGPFHAAPDWTIWPGMEARDASTVSGYDAMRIPLYTAWAGVRSQTAVAMVQGWAATGQAVLPMRAGAGIGQHGAQPGDSARAQPGDSARAPSQMSRANQAHADIAALTRDVTGAQTPGTGLDQPWCGGDYYESVLRLLALAARLERLR